METMSTTDLPFPSCSPWTNPGDHLLARLRTWRAMPEGADKARFWDLRVNWIVGEWLRANKPGLDVLEAEGFGNIRYGSSSAGALIPLVETLALRGAWQYFGWLERWEDGVPFVRLPSTDGWDQAVPMKRGHDGLRSRFFLLKEAVDAPEA